MTKKQYLSKRVELIANRDFVAIAILDSQWKAQNNKRKKVKNA